MINNCHTFCVCINNITKLWYTMFTLKYVSTRHIQFSILENVLFLFMMQKM